MFAYAVACSASFARHVQVRARQLSEGQVAIIVREVLLGLKFLWKEKKIHRDIKCTSPFVFVFALALSQTGSLLILGLWLLRRQHSAQQIRTGQAG